MRLKKIGTGNYLDCTVDGAVLTIGSTIVDCRAHQSDAQTVVDICIDAAGAEKIGAVGSVRYAANVVIPPKRYIESAVLDDTGPVLDDDGNIQLKSTAVELDMHQVTVQLWPFSADEDETLETEE